MSNNRCDYCGEDALDCDCSGSQEWYSWDDMRPAEGQLCRIRRSVIYDAYYTGEPPYSLNIIDYVKVPDVQWRPLYRSEQKEQAV